MSKTITIVNLHTRNSSKVFFVVPILLLAFFSASIRAEQPNNLYIVLLAGQSNMAGRGYIRPAIDTIIYNNIFSLDKDSVWVRARHPLHWDKATAGVGPGLAFAHELALKIGGNVNIGLVPCAAGGTKIEEWNANVFFPNTGNFFLYSNLISRAKKAAKSGRIIGMIWHQGEYNANTSNYKGYKEKVALLFNNIRKDLNMPDLPIVSGELGTYLKATSYTRWDTINYYINQLKYSISNYDIASSAPENGVELSCNSDLLHFTSASQVIMGQRYAEKLYSLVSQIFTSTDIQKEPLFNIRIENKIIRISQNADTASNFTLFDSRGVQLKSVNLLQSETNIDLSNFKGVFIAFINTQQGAFTQKIIL
jgi:hypothetical protein